MLILFLWIRKLGDSDIKSMRVNMELGVMEAQDASVAAGTVDYNPFTGGDFKVV